VLPGEEIPSLILEVWDKRVEEEDDYIGMTEVEIVRFKNKKEEIEIDVKDEEEENGGPEGKLKLEVLYEVEEPTERRMGAEEKEGEGEEKKSGKEETKEREIEVKEPKGILKVNMKTCNV
jgi:hypothetical protein